jgi:hypothetical protein
VSISRQAKCAAVGILFYFGGSLSAAACTAADWTDFCPLGVTSIVMSEPDEDGGSQCDVLCDDGNTFPTPRIDCIRGDKERTSYNCEVWPRGEGLVYEWSSEGLTTFSINGETELVQQQIFCPRVSLATTVNLRIDTPDGASKTASFTLSCGKFVELYLQGKERAIMP